MLTAKLQHNIFFKEGKYSFYHKCKITSLFLFTESYSVSIKVEKSYVAEPSPDRSGNPFLIPHSAGEKKIGTKSGIPMFNIAFFAHAPTSQKVGYEW